MKYDYWFAKSVLYTAMYHIAIGCKKSRCCFARQRRYISDIAWAPKFLTPKLKYWMMYYIPSLCLDSTSKDSPFCLIKNIAKYHGKKKLFFPVLIYIVWNNITCPCPWHVLLAQKFSFGIRTLRTSSISFHFILAIKLVALCLLNRMICIS